MTPLSSLMLVRTASARAVLLAAIAALASLATPSRARAQKALVYCPIGIDVAGCANLVAALQPVFPSGVDRGYDGSSGTVDLRTANLWGYSLVAIPSLATSGGATPYAVLSDTAIGSRLHDAILGRIALWSGTPDLGSPNGTQKDTLIQNLGKWAGANYGAVKGPGLVVFQDMSDSIATQYGWLHIIVGTGIQGDSTVSTHATVQGATATGTALLRDPSGNAIAYANMAAFGFLAPGAGSGFAVDGIAASASGTQNVMLTSLGGNSGSATIATDADDYPPGSIVTITGAGFAPGEKVIITLRERPYFDTPATAVAVADKSGGFVDTSFSPDSADVGVRFIATATGQSSALRAVTTFTDAISINGNALTAGPQSPATVAAGGSVTFALTVGFNGNNGSCTVALSVTGGLPAGATATFSPATLTSTANTNLTSALTIATTSATPVGNSNIGLRALGTGGSGNDCNASKASITGVALSVSAPALIAGNTSLNSSAPASTFGQSVTFTATVSPASGTTSPTGTIQFVDNGTNIGPSVPLTGGVATFSTATLGAGSHTISATYTPGSGFASGTVSSVTQTVGKATPSLAWGTPSAISYGTALGATQLNAVAIPTAGTLTYTPAVGAVLTAGAQTLSVTFTPTDGADYTPASASVVLTVNKLAATAKADDQTRLFGQANPTLTGTITGFLPADNISATYATTAGPTTNVGTYPITPTLVDPNGRLGNYAVTPVAGTLTINKTDQTITFGQPSDPTYGDSPLVLSATASSGLPVAFTATGTCSISGNSLSINAAGPCIVTASQPGDQNRNPAPDVAYALTVKKAMPAVTAQGGTFTYDGLTHGATAAATGVGNSALTPVTVTYDGGSALPKNAGTYAVVATFAGSSDYLPGSANTTVTIDKRPLSVTADDKSKVYGAGAPSFTASYAGFVTNEGPTDLVGTLAFSGAAATAVDVGTYSITPSGVTSQNYAIAFNSGNLTISKASLAVEAADASRVYGDANPAFTGTLTGVVNNDNITASYSSAADDGSSVGTVAITATLNDPNGRIGNYIVTNTSGKLTITPAALTIAAASATRLYGGVNPAFTGTITGIKNGDPITASYSTTATLQDNVGNYAIVPAAVDPTPSRIGNYSVTVTNGTLSITPAPLAVTTNASTKVYGDQNPTFSVAYAGFVNNESPAALGGTLVFATSADPTTGVGSVAVTAGGLSSTNYNITFVAGQLTITPAPLTITAADANRLYGGTDPVFTGTVSGVKNGDAITATYSTNATPTSNVGTYPIAPAPVDGSPARLQNYTVSLKNGVLTVTPAPLTITADAATKIYGDANPAFSVTYSGFVNNEAPTILGGTLAFTTVANVTTGVGAATVTPSGLSSTNYSITFAPGQLTITQAPLTIAAANATRVFGAGDPAFTGTITGIKNNDGITAKYTTSATTLSNVGLYDITPAAVDASPPTLANYQVTLNKGTLTITKATPAVTWAPLSPIAQGTALSSAQLNATATGVGGAAVAGTFTYVPPAGTVLYDVATTPLGTTFTSTDGNYLNANGAAQVVVTNVAPKMLSITLGAAPIGVNTPASVSATFADPGLDDKHTASITWGDGTSSGGIVVEGTLVSPNGSVSASHTYTSAGVYTVTVAVSDDHNGSDTRSSAVETIGYVVVYDPSAGFVTGGGWIASPVGACKLASCTASTTGKANFGFNARYQKGANVPDGSTEFQFQAGGLNFKSTVYSWLVVAGTRAQYKGSGMINGVAGYGFILTAIDGDSKGNPDAFRMKIMDSGGNVVYDNQMGADDTGNASTTLGGGSIVIHQ